ncbi:MAG: ATP-binding protein [Verrucomicrobiota bacterium]
MWRLMQAEGRRAAMRSQKLITLMIVTMVPAFSILDYFAYPEHFERFAFLRILCTLVTVGVYLLIRSQLGKRFYRVFTVALPLVPAFFIAVMVFFSGDPGTPYYAGLTLCIVAIGFVFHWTYQEAFWGTIAIAVMYLVASSPAVLNGMDTKTAASFVNNCIFIAAKGLVIVSGCFAHNRFRIQEFKVRERSRQQKATLRAQKEELLSALEELNQAEDQLIQSEKMASLGQLSAGVIHEIGNPLNYSNQALFLLRKQLRNVEHDSQIDEAVQDIQESLDRMKDIVMELREFSHKSSEIKIDYPLVDSVNVAIRVLGKEIEDSETSVVVSDPTNVRIEGVKNQITQVLINLIHNAVQAMEKDSPEDEHQIQIRLSTSNEWVELSVKDNGPGMSESVRSKIFDPFYTTKEVGEGTGLGLSISFRIVEAHGGRIQVLSRPAEYTEFRIQFPVVGTQEQAAHHLPSKDRANPSDSRTHENPVH